MNKTELLAPAGDIERAKIALLYGADAVYIGGKKFSLRANASNFDIPEINELCIFAHKLAKKIYVTVNIVFHNEDFDGLLDYLKELENCHIDGIMVSDLSVIDLVNENKLDINLYLSTQASAFNYETVKYYQSKNVKRVVLARECSKDNIKRIADETGIEIECFIHGAMCISISGKCVMSNYCTLRDANRGGCAQICRWHFDIGEDKDFTFSPKDLNMFNYIKDMIDSDVYSFKIEGRMRSSYYIATVVYIYRKIIDGIVNNSLDDAYIKYCLNVLNRCANRESAPQFFQKEIDYTDQYYQDRDEVSNQDFLGIVKSYDEEKKIMIIEQRNYFKKGDTIQIFGPSIDEMEFVVDKMYDEKDDLIEIANHPQMIVKIPFPNKVVENDMMRIKIFDKNNII